MIILRIFAQIYCVETNPNVCPDRTQCLETPNQPGRRACCRSTEAPRVCPDGLDALLKPGTNNLERCNAPGNKRF